jgi:hypothetical protein
MLDSEAPRLRSLSWMWGCRSPSVQQQAALCSPAAAAPPGVPGGLPPPSPDCYPHAGVQAAARDKGSGGDCAAAADPTDNPWTYSGPCFELAATAWPAPAASAPAHQGRALPTSTKAGGGRGARSGGDGKGLCPPAAPWGKDVEAPPPPVHRPPAPLLPPPRWRAPGRGACGGVGAMVAEMWPFVASVFGLVLVSAALVPGSFLAAGEVGAGVGGSGNDATLLLSARAARLPRLASRLPPCWTAHTRLRPSSESSQWLLVDSWYPLILLASYYLVRPRAGTAGAFCHTKASPMRAQRALFFAGPRGCSARSPCRNIPPPQGDFLGKLLPVLQCPDRRTQGRVMLSLTAGRTVLFVPLLVAAGRTGAPPAAFICLAFGLAVSGFYEGVRAWWQRGRSPLQVPSTLPQRPCGTAPVPSQTRVAHPPSFPLSSSMPPLQSTASPGRARGCTPMTLGRWAPCCASRCTPRCCWAPHSAFPGTRLPSPLQ